jgi:hypothetical protein
MRRLALLVLGFCVSTGCTVSTAEDHGIDQASAAITANVPESAAARLRDLLIAAEVPGDFHLTPEGEYSVFRITSTTPGAALPSTYLTLTQESGAFGPEDGLTYVIHGSLAEDFARTFADMGYTASEWYPEPLYFMYWLTCGPDGCTYETGI